MAEGPGPRRTVQDDPVAEAGVGGAEGEHAAGDLAADVAGQADGRDMGTVIFPDARWKVFLTASAEERAERRYKQLKNKGVSVTMDGLLREILARDARDANRAVAPLRPAEEAVRIDTTGLGIDAVVSQVLALLPARMD